MLDFFTNAAKDELILARRNSQDEVQLMLRGTQDLTTVEQLPARLQSALDRLFQPSESTIYTFRRPGNDGRPVLFFSKHMSINDFLYDFLWSIDCQRLDVEVLATPDMYAPIPMEECPSLLRWDDESTGSWGEPLNYRNFVKACRRAFPDAGPCFEIDARYASEGIDSTRFKPALALEDTDEPTVENIADLGDLARSTDAPVLQIFRRIVRHPPFTLILLSS